MGAVIERSARRAFQPGTCLAYSGFSGLQCAKAGEARHRSATRMPCAAGNAVLGQPLKKSPARRPADRLRGRVRHQRTPHACAPGRPRDRRPSSSFTSTGTTFGHRWTHAHQLLVPAARGQHQEGRDRRLPQGAQGPSEATAAGDLGWLEGASQSLGARLPGYAERHIQIAFLSPYAPDLNPVEYLWAWLKRHALANYCPNDRASCTPPHATTQERSKASFDHCRLLDAGYALVMS